MAKAFAAVNIYSDKGDEIDVRTVAPTQIGAMVNWLYLKGYRPNDDTSDATIRFLFNSHGEQVRLAAVTIELSA